MTPVLVDLIPSAADHWANSTSSVQSLRDDQL